MYNCYYHEKELWRNIFNENVEYINGRGEIIAVEESRSGVHGVESVCRMSKCEMAKLLNKETCFKEMLDKRDQIIKGLDQKIKEMEKEQKSKTRSKLFLLLMCTE